MSYKFSKNVSRVSDRLNWLVRRRSSGWCFEPTSLW